jgi:hypothetical protein
MRKISNSPRLYDFGVMFDGFFAMIQGDGKSEWFVPRDWQLNMLAHAILDGGGYARRVKEEIHGPYTYQIWKTDAGNSFYLLNVTTGMTRNFTVTHIPKHDGAQKLSN